MSKRKSYINDAYRVLEIVSLNDINGELYNNLRFGTDYKFDIERKKQIDDFIAKQKNEIEELDTFLNLRKKTINTALNSIRSARLALSDQKVEHTEYSIDEIRKSLKTVMDVLQKTYEKIENFQKKISTLK